MVPQPHLDLKNLYTAYLEKGTAHNAQRGDRWQIQKPAIMYQSLKRLHFSISPRVLAGLKGTYTYRTHQSISEEHTGWVHAFTFIYTHLADALFCRGTPATVDGARIFFFFFFFFDHLPSRVKVRDRASWKSETLDDSVRENVRENKREKSKLIWEVSWIFISYFLLIFFEKRTDRSRHPTCICGMGRCVLNNSCFQEDSAKSRTFLFLVKGEVHEIWRLLIGRGKKKKERHRRNTHRAAKTSEKAGNTRRIILHHGG